MKKATLALACLSLSPVSGHAQVCSEDWLRGRVASSIGGDRLAPAMAKLLAAYRASRPDLGEPSVWRHDSDASAMAALMFELADVAPLSREFTPPELAPYDHQFRGDMMKQPEQIEIGSVSGRKAVLAVNRRPDSPLPPRTRELIAFALSDGGQAALASATSFTPLSAEARVLARARLDTGYLAPLDPGLGSYQPKADLRGTIRSVGSDGLKSLMDGWFCRFSTLQPGVTKGARWEHFGTLNGFEALLAGEADIAPMGRELWPAELADWQKVFGNSAPFEVRIARGGFNTQQRTTAQAIFVHRDNPLTAISTAQLAAIFGANPSITRWGQLGLRGPWADRPIRPLTPPKAAPNTMSFQINVLHGAAWNGSSEAGTVAALANALLADETAIGFGGLEDGLPGLKVLQVGWREGAAIPLTSVTAANGRYPLTRYMYVRLAPGKPSAATIAFLRYVLSREAQERVRYSGYFPLTGAEAAAEIAKLEGLDQKGLEAR